MIAQMGVEQPNTAVGPLIFMHRQPCGDGEGSRCWQHLNQIGIAGGNSGLANANPRTGAQQGKLRQGGAPD
jgi:hypothetical protein